MEIESKDLLESRDRKQRNYNTFLTAFVAVTFTVALLQGVGFVIFYAHFQTANIALEARIAAVEARELAVSALEAAPSDSNTGETPSTSAKLYRVSPSHYSTADACTLTYIDSSTPYTTQFSHNRRTHSAACSSTIAIACLVHYLHVLPSFRNREEVSE